jgi:hypothetical protein
MLGSAIIYPPLIRRLGQCKQIQIMTFVSLICSQTCNLVIGLNTKRRQPPIYTLNEDVLLNIFHLYRLADVLTKLPEALPLRKPVAPLFFIFVGMYLHWNLKLLRT